MCVFKIYRHILWKYSLIFILNYCKKYTNMCACIYIWIHVCAYVYTMINTNASNFSSTPQASLYSFNCLQICSLAVNPLACISLRLLNPLLVYSVQPVPQPQSSLSQSAISAPPWHSLDAWLAYGHVSPKRKGKGTWREKDRTDFSSHFLHLKVFLTICTCPNPNHIGVH